MHIYIYVHIYKDGEGKKERCKEGLNKGRKERGRREEGRKGRSGEGRKTTLRTYKDVLT